MLRSFACLGIMFAAQSAVTVQSLRRLAAVNGNGPAIAAAAREQPDTLREALARTFALSTSVPAEQIPAELATARRLAEGYARAWADSFLVRDVADFEAWNRDQRRARVTVDSLQRAGIAALGQDGVPAAMALWRQALTGVASVDRARRATVLGSLGAGFYLGTEFDSARVYLIRSRDIAARVGDFRTLGNAIGILASIARDQGDLLGAVELYQQALRIRERVGDRRGLAADHNNLGLIAWELGDLEEARRGFWRALDLNRRDGRRREIALNLANLADIASLTGEYGRADTLYRQALAINRADGDRAETAFVLHDLGLLASKRGQYIEARASLAAALRMHEEAGATIETIAVRRDLAAVEAATGDLQGAMKTLRRAERDAAEAAEQRALQAGLALTAADIAVQLGAFADAETGYARAERLYRDARDDAGRAEAQEGRALLLYLREDHAGALQLLDLATRAHVTSGDGRAAALTRLLTGHVQREAGDTAAALRTFRDVLQALQSVGDPVGEAAALDGLGLVQSAQGSALAAELSYQRAFDALGTRRAPEVRWQLHAHLAEALRSRGALEAAARHLRDAIAILEQAAGGLRIEERRVGYLADKWYVYASLALVEQQRGRSAEAFASSERLRARQMRDLLERGHLPLRREVSAREQDLRRRINELMAELGTEAVLPRGERESPLTQRPADAVREGLDRVQRQYAELLLDLREQDPAYARLVSGETVPWQSVAARLKPDEILLEYLVTDSGSTVFAVTADTIIAVDLNIGRAMLSNMIEFARRTLDRPGVSVAGPLWRAPLRRLFEYLVQPMEQAGLLNGKRRLVIVPHGELHFLPFAALLSEGQNDQLDRFLIERFELIYAPSATVWVRLAEGAPVPELRGVLALAPRTSSLPASREEVLDIRGSHGPRVTVLLGDDATERAFRAAAPDHAILHLATFGILNKHNPLFSFVELAAADGDDGRLEVHEVYGLELAGQLVVLSACQTALGSGTVGDVPPGDDWVGLVQAFLHAGARSVLASLWPVEDRATARLMQEFYRRLAADESEATALAQAQRAMLRSPGSNHPFGWAGFVLVGAGRE